MELDRYRILFDQAPVCIHEIDGNGRLLAMNRAAWPCSAPMGRSQFGDGTTWIL